MPPRTGRRVFGIDHPSLLGDVPLLEPAQPPPLRSGFVGAGRGAKRLLEFAQLAREVRQRYPDAEFHVVGSVPRGLAREALGDIGCLCDSVMDIHDTIVGLLSSFSANHDRRQREQLQQARERLVPEAYAADLHRVLSRQAQP